MVPKFQGRSFHMGEVNTARNENEQGGFNKWKQANIFFSCGVNNEAYVDAAV